MEARFGTVLMLALAGLCACDSGTDDAGDCEAYKGLSCVGPGERAVYFDEACSRIACCEGTSPREFLMPVRIWQPNPENDGVPAGCTLEHGLAEHTLCVACGDGVCDQDALENWCVCPEDCPESGHNPCAAIEAKVAACKLPKFDRDSCFPYTTCAIDCMLDASCDELANLADAATLNYCLWKCNQGPDTSCVPDGVGGWLSRECDACPDTPPKEGTACGVSAHVITCLYPSATPAEKPYNTCECATWKWHCH